MIKYLLTVHGIFHTKYINYSKHFESVVENANIYVNDLFVRSICQIEPNSVFFAELNAIVNELQLKSGRLKLLLGKAFVFVYLKRNFVSEQKDEYFGIGYLDSI